MRTISIILLLAALFYCTATVSMAGPICGNGGSTGPYPSWPSPQNPQWVHIDNGCPHAVVITSGHQNRSNNSTSEPQATSMGWTTIPALGKSWLLLYDRLHARAYLQLKSPNGHIISADDRSFCVFPLEGGDSADGFSARQLFDGTHWITTSTRNSSNCYREYRQEGRSCLEAGGEIQNGFQEIHETSDEINIRIEGDQCEP